MFKEKDHSKKTIKYKKGNLKFAVIGHIEWINFLRVNTFPKPGNIIHSKKSLEMPAGGGSVIARTLSKLTKNKVHFFTSLGKDFYGHESCKILKKMGLILHVAWRDIPTRKGFSLIDREGERAITIIGERLSPKYTDNLEWDILSEMDGIFITAGDKILFQLSREAKTLCVTPRVGVELINESKVCLDGLIGSNLDPGEIFDSSNLKITPRYIIKTEGDKGGFSIPGGKFNAIHSTKKIIDSYGCGDTFAAGILYGLTSKWNIEKTIKLGTVLGRNCIDYFGPYANMNNIIE